MTTHTAILTAVITIIMIEYNPYPQALATMRLWQLISPTLPVGAYAYSQGLEYAIDAGWVNNEAEVKRWIEGLVTHSLARLDVPLLSRLYDGWKRQDVEQIHHWNALLLASRESAEILAEDQHLGGALLKLLTDLDVERCQHWQAEQPGSFATMFALAAVHWHIALEDAAIGYVWSWCENQIAVAIKLVPLGQTAGQRILSQLMTGIEHAVQHGLKVQDDDIGMVSQGLGIASALHETQYSRLFRS